MTISGTQLVSEIEALARAAGYKYVYGGTGPSGYDCSGLVYEALLKLGYSNPPRTSEEQWAWVTKVNASVSNPPPIGTLVFAQFPGDNASPGHVGIYIGNGDVYSAQDASLGIGISSLASWGNNIVGYGTVPAESTSASSGNPGGSDNPPGGFTLTSDNTSGAPSWVAGVPGLSWIVGTATGLSDVATALKDMANMFALLFKPSLYFRIGAFFAGIVFLSFGIYMLAKVVDSDIHLPSAPSVVPIPV